MKKYVKVRTPSRQIIVKGNLVRTPVNFIAEESEISLYESIFRGQDIIDYEIKDYIPVKKPSTKIIKKEKTKSSESKSVTTNTALDSFLE